MQINHALIQLLVKNNGVHEQGHFMRWCGGVCLHRVFVLGRICWVAERPFFIALNKKTPHFGAGFFYS
jgi:hypothetical protein